MSKLLLGLLSAGIVLFSQNPVMATTYEYIGPLYTFKDDDVCGGCLGTHMTGTITLNFDSSSASGTFNNFTNTALVSGSIQGSAGSPENFITLTNGSFTAWSMFDPAENPACSCVFSTIFNGSVGSDNVSHEFWASLNGFPAFPYITHASTGALTVPGVWASVDLTPIPLPPALMLFASGLGVLSLLGWRRKRKAAAQAAA